MSYSASTIGLPRVARLQLRQQRGFFADLGRDAKEDAAPVLRRCLRPAAFIEGIARRGHRGVYIGRAGIGNFRDNFFGRRIIDRNAVCRKSLLSTLR